VAELPGGIIALKNKSNFIYPFSFPVSKLITERRLKICNEYGENPIHYSTMEMV
jgi:hypothetical protein